MYTWSKQVSILRHLSHPHVVEFVQFYYQDSDYFYMVMEYMARGQLLTRIMKKVGSPHQAELDGLGQERLQHANVAHCIPHSVHHILHSKCS